MRFLQTFAISSGTVSSVGAAPVCSVSTLADSGSYMSGLNDWYKALTYCAITVTDLTPEGWFTCLNTLTGTNAPASAAGVNLAASFNTISVRADLPSDCFKCAFDYALAASVAMHQNDYALTHACKNELDQYSDSSVIEPGCLSGLYEAITAFNTCANNGIDFVTKAASVRCTIEEFTNFAIQFNPVDSGSKCAHDDTAITTVAQLNACIGSDFVAAKANLGCKSCFDPLLLAVQQNAHYCGNGDYDPDTGCLSSLQEDLSTFATCTGGMMFSPERETHCSTDQIRIIDAMRPFKSVVECVFMDYTTDHVCLDYYSSIFELWTLLTTTPIIPFVRRTF